MSNDWKVNDDESQLPLDVGGDSAETSFGGEKRPFINTTTLLLASVFLAGLGLIFVLGKQAGPRSASAEQQTREAQIEAALGELASHAGKGDGKVKDTDSLVRLFQDNRAPRDSAADAAGDPFAIVSAKKPDTVAEAAVPATIEDPAEQQRYRKVAETIAALKVQSIMYSKRGGAAMINNKLAEVGSKFGDLVVSQIDQDRVILSFADKKFELRLARPKSE